MLGLCRRDEMRGADTCRDPAEVVDDVAFWDRPNLAFVENPVWPRFSAVDDYARAAVLPDSAVPDPARSLVATIFRRVVGFIDYSLLRVVSVDVLARNTAINRRLLPAAARATLRLLVRGVLLRYVPSNKPRWLTFDVAVAFRGVRTSRDRCRLPAAAFAKFLAHLRDSNRLDVQSFARRVGQ